MQPVSAARLTQSTPWWLYRAGIWQTLEMDYRIWLLKSYSHAFLGNIHNMFAIYFLYRIYKSKLGMGFKGWGTRHILRKRTKLHGGRKRALKPQLATRMDVKRMINQNKETKFAQQNQVTLSSTHTASVPIITLLNGLSQGDTDANRDGDIVLWTNLKIRMLFNTSGSAMYKVQIIRQKKARGAAPTLLEMFGSATPSPINYPQMTSQDFYTHFEILYNRELNITSNYSAQTVHTLCEIDLAPDMRTDYSLGNAGTAADIDTNALYLVIRTDNATAATIYYTNVFKFKDI